MQPKAERQSEVVEILRSVQGPTEATPGCLGCWVYEGSGPEAGLLLYEEWEGEAGLYEHIRSDLYRRILGALELSSRPPEIGFHRVASAEGIELIEQLRGVRLAGSLLDERSPRNPTGKHRY